MRTHPQGLDRRMAVAGRKLQAACQNHKWTQEKWVSEACAQRLPAVLTWVTTAHHQHNIDTRNSVAAAVEKRSRACDMIAQA